MNSNLLGTATVLKRLLIVGLALYSILLLNHCAPHSPALHANLALEQTRQINRAKAQQEQILALCFDSGYCFSGYYRHGRVHNYVIAMGDSAETVIEAMTRQNDGRYLVSQFTPKGDTLEWVEYDENSKSLQSRSYYAGGILKEKGQRKGDVFIREQYTLKGETALVKDTLSDSLVVHSELDSLGAIIGQTHYNQGRMIKKLGFKNDSKILEIVYVGEGADTLVYDTTGQQGTRSALEIMEVVKARTPELREIYNRYLEVITFAGKHLYRFKISAKGHVQFVIPYSFPTGSPLPFIHEIAEVLGTWEFKAISRGTTTVTIPFTFSE
jgi:antitoxin component YwqK of YwqJK toxin-antitoxin module